MKAVLTIGVYGWTADAWIAALRRARCDAVVDIRARRGVRGSTFAFADRARLEVLLRDAGIRYLYRPELAPSRTLRDGQSRVDHAMGTLKRDRASLAPEFIQGYEAEVEVVSWRALADGFGANRPCLLCVERVPDACHRSVAARHLAQAGSVGIEDLVP